MVNPLGLLTLADLPLRLLEDGEYKAEHMPEEVLPKPSVEPTLPSGNNPSFLSGLKASHETVKLYVALIAEIGGVPTAVLGLDKLYFHNLSISSAIFLV